MTTRLSRPDQVLRNRERLLDAAREVFLDRGYGGATVDAIAETAGFSKGVVYSQFSGKSDLFLALVEGRIAERAEENDRLAAGHPGREVVAALLRADARHTRAAGDWARLLIEFRAVAARDPGLNERYAALHRRTLEHFAAAVVTGLAADGLTLAAPPATFAQLAMAVSSGAVLERAADPDALPVEVVEALLTRLVVPR